MRIAVAGGTGLVGALVVEALRTREQDVVALSRGGGVDVSTGVGLDAALAGVEVVVDVLNLNATSAEASIDFFTATTRSLLAAEERSGVAHHLALSIVGVDRAPAGYYAGKWAQEQLIEASPVSWTILRATQFHEFAAQIFGGAKVGPLHIAPRMRTQPVAAREVAARLAELAVGGPSGRAIDLAGPREESLVEMIRAFAGATGHRGWIPAISLPGAFGRAQRDGSMLPGTDAQRGTQTFAEWVAGIAAER